MQTKTQKAAAGNSQTPSTTVKGVGTSEINITYQYGRVYSVKEIVSETSGTPCIALDGSIQGVYLDPINQVYSFDHHSVPVDASTLAETVNQYNDNVSAYSFSTRSTAAQVWAAINMGLNPKGFTVYVNDCDPDTTLSVHMLAFPDRINNPTVIEMVRTTDVVDSITYGAAIFGRTALYSSLMHPYADRNITQLVTDLETITKYIDQGDAWKAPGVVSPSTTGKAIVINANDQLETVDTMTTIHQLISSGARAFCLYTDASDGMFTVQVGKMSVFVNSFDLQTFYNEVNKIESNKNGTWGGSDIAGGSPRQSGTNLTVFQLTQAFQKAFTDPNVDNQ